MYYVVYIIKHKSQDYKLFTSTFLNPIFVKLLLLSNKTLFIFPTLCQISCV